MSKNPKHDDADEAPETDGATTAEQADLDISTAGPTGPVECLGMTFPSDAARREHFLKELAKKLTDPAFRKIEGFPIGEDEDILALSDPPYYTACPNPWLADFVKHYGKPYTPKDKYHREPFAADVSEGKNHPIYNAHSYHTKVPHRAIMRYILHYTQPGDLVFDGFAGTGMTGVAAQLCGDREEVQALGYKVRADGVILNEEGNPFSTLGARLAILNDLAPAATFIAHNYNSHADVLSFQRDANRILKEVSDEVGWMHETTHTDGKSKGRVNSTVWSDVFICSACQDDVVFLDAAVDADGEISAAEFPCPHCGVTLAKASATKRMEKALTQTGTMVERIAKVPVLIDYTTSEGRYEKKPDKADIRLLDRIQSVALPAVAPRLRLDKNKEQYKRDALHLRGIETISDFYTRRNVICLSALWTKASKLSQNRLLALFWITSIQWLASNMYRYRAGGGGGQQGKLTIPSLIREQNVLRLAADKLKDVLRVATMLARPGRSVAIATGDAANPGTVAPLSIDYAFIDPPFGGNLFYSDLNAIWEGWLGVVTQEEQDAVIHRVQTKNPKGLGEYAGLMESAFREVFALLKPGRWLTVEFSNSQAVVWNAIQTTLQEAGFVVANVAALDKKQRSFRSITSPTAVKQDLVISAYKPNGGLEDRFAKSGETEAGVWDFIRTHLGNLPVAKPRGGQLEPIAERDARILFDRTVAFYVRHGMPVPISSPEFQSSLAEKFPERDGMYFLPDQAAEYDKVRMKMEGIGQLTIFVEDERSAVNWLRNYLKSKPSKYQDIQPEFFEQLNQSWKKWETRPELRALLDQYFLCYGGDGDVPPQIHSYLSTNFKELRTLPADHAMLRAKARDRWFVPDPRKNADVEQLREKRLLEEFWSYLPPGYEAAARTRKPSEPMLPGMQQLPPKLPKGKRIAIVRTEAVRVGFNFCFGRNDYTTIIAVTQHIPDDVIHNDEQLQMIYDSAVTRTGGEGE